MITKKICFVQFTHPGSEHGIDRGSANYKSWNYGEHKRKFLKATGSLFDKGKIESDQDLMFWGEWEPQSQVTRITNPHWSKDYPKYMHVPQLDLSAPKFNTLGQPRQNTDPFVFADRFYYRCCKQQKFSSLKNLEKGSIILFGSTINANKTSAYFAVDTVFVVGDYREYDSSAYKEQLEGFISADYDEIVGIGLDRSDKNSEKACGEVEASVSSFSAGAGYRCYSGATPNDKVGNMYSFVPCKRYENGTIGFERLKVSESDFSSIKAWRNILTNNLNAAPKITELSIADNFKAWTILRDLTKAQGLLEGVSFKY